MFLRGGEKNCNFPKTPLNEKNWVNKLWDLLSSIKEGFWLQGHIFSCKGAQGGGPKKYFIEGGEKNWNFPKTPLNEKIIG